VNSYDSLSSRRYQELVKRWSSAGTLTYGRYFKVVNSNQALTDPEFLLSNVGLILSAHPLASDRLRLAAEVEGIKIYQTVAAPIDLQQTTAFRFLENGAADIDAAQVSKSNLRLSRSETLNDYLKIKVTPWPGETLLFVSQQYHPDWRARANKKALQTVVVNDFYQGVILPPNTSEVEFSFRPASWWSWLPQLFFAVGALLILGATVVDLSTRARTHYFFQSTL
jgi:hypothetical protein